MSRKNPKNKKQAIARRAQQVADKMIRQGSQLPVDFPASMSAGMSFSRQELYSGPVPPPAMLAEFDKIDPGRAGKLLQLAEDQSRHRMKQEDTVITGDNRRSWAGLWVGAFICLSILACGTYLVATGHDTAGATIITGTLVSGASVFVYGRYSQSAERREKSKKA